MEDHVIGIAKVFSFDRTEINNYVQSSRLIEFRMNVILKKEEKITRKQEVFSLFQKKDLNNKIALYIVSFRVKERKCFVFFGN